jgi:hypothetical protein
LRKSLFVAATAALAFSTAGVAYAQTVADPSIDVTASFSPTKSGTTSKPKSEKITLKVVNNPDSKTTAKSIAITFPSTLKLSTKGLDQCKATDDALIEDVNVCKKSIAGKGNARALLNPFATAPAPLNFKVTPVIGKNEIIFVLSGSANAVLHGKISGKKLTIAITPALQQPVTGTFSALNDLSTTLSKKKGDNSLISSTGCKAKKHKISVTVGYAPNPNAPSKPSATNTADAKCS